MEPNGTSENGSDILSNEPSTARVVTYSVIYGFISLIALVGNSLVCLVILKNRKMRTVTNAFLLNLAITDILFIVFSVPALLAMLITASWPLGNTLCKTVPFLNTLTLSASIYTMVALAIDRYNAIVHPLKAKVAHTIKRTTIVISIIWVLSAVVSFPQILTQSLVYDKGQTYCKEDWSPLNGILGKKIYGVSVFIIFFAIPITIITIAYTTIIKRLMTTDSMLSETVRLSQERSSSVGCKSPTDDKLVEKTNAISRNNRKTTMMMLTVIVVFLICMLPFNVLLLATPFLIYGTYDYTAFYNAWSVLGILAVCASACNPIIYNFFSVKFRKAFLDVFRCRCSTAHGQDEANDTYPIHSSFRTKRTSIL